MEDFQIPPTPSRAQISELSDEELEKLRRFATKLERRVRTEVQARRQFSHKIPMFRRIETVTANEGLL